MYYIENLYYASTKHVNLPTFINQLPIVILNEFYLFLSVSRRVVSTLEQLGKKGEISKLSKTSRFRTFLIFKCRRTRIYFGRLEKSSRMAGRNRD